MLPVPIYLFLLILLLYIHFIYKCSILILFIFPRISSILAGVITSYIIKWFCLLVPSSNFLAIKNANVDIFILNQGCYSFAFNQASIGAVGCFPATLPARYT
jgi:hypothetical protein